MKSKQGFTLIELLVVIAIIAILAAILFPIFAAARERGRTTACLNNVNQITKAVLQYADDWKGMFPYCCDFEDRVSHPETANTPFIWDVLASYTKSKDIWRCPSDKGMTWRYGSSAGTIIKNCYKAFGSSYVMNYSNVWYPQGTLNPCKMDQARDLTKAMVVFDVWQTSSSGPDPNAWNSQWHNRKYPISSWNIGFFDGHARNMTFNNIRYPPNRPTDITWLFSAYWCRPDAPPGW